MKNSRVSSAVQRYMSQHDVYQRDGELAGLKRRAGIRTPEPFHKELNFRGPVRPDVRVSANLYPKTILQIALEARRG